jgi:hypothetical protein
MSANAAHIFGRLAFADGRPLHLALAEARGEGLDAADVTRGWYAERQDRRRRRSGDRETIGGGM